MRSATAATAKQGPRVVIATNDGTLASAAQQVLASSFDLTIVSPEQCLQSLDEGVGAFVIDAGTLFPSRQQVLRLVGEIRAVDADVLVILISPFDSPNFRVAASNAGVDELFFLPVDFRELKIVLQRALEKRQIEIDARLASEEIVGKASFCGIIGGSEPMRRVYDAISRVAESSSTVLILGESGTGKELVARAIVALSPRQNKPFISVNCAALPETLIEAELFGPEKGAFTGADAARPGHIELAQGGTLLLDEIGTLGLGLQAKLLRVLEDRSVTRIGGKVPRKIDFRLLVASNEDLEESVHAGRFREDLYYRINVVPIFLPPLREREGDIPLLVDHFLRLYSGANRLPVKRIEPDALEMLEEYGWPGNVRQLENLIQRLVLMVDGPVISARHLPQQILYASIASSESILIPGDGVNFDEEMARVETAYLRAALRRTNGRKADAAAILHISPRKMKYLCQKYKP